MSLIFGVALVLALLTGLAIGLLGTTAYYERLSLQQRRYENEIAQSTDLYVMLAASQRARRIKPTDR